MITHLLVLSVHSQLVLHSFSEVEGVRKVWVKSETCCLQGMINEGEVLEQDTYSIIIS